ncbi:LPXTG cell wall anchor domain-containing protein [Sphingomonas hengshuiensis]|uniref:LPXTG cell wall anchor domain-containing protein n=1 Tax=Sphingomonas hengshuiensis TaxID=1609977 RepID=UPI000A63157E|nr:LPXTG cell wall anchor domain-containing protein [Sphingomonas hengshuiensis]
MSSNGFLSSLNLMTLVVGLIVVAIGFAFFLRKRRNRHPLDGQRERNVAQDLDAGKSAPDHLPPS